MRPLHRGLRRILLVGLLLVALTGALLPMGSNAQAETATEAAAVCPVDRGLYGGLHICAYQPKDFPYQDRTHTFVVGSNRQIYYIWQRYRNDTVWSGWRSLGGAGYSAVKVFAWGAGMRIEVTGIQLQPTPVPPIRFRPYCKLYMPANGWTPWYGC